MTAPLDPNDAAAGMNSAFVDDIGLAEACELLRACDVIDVLIRGFDDRFLRDIERNGCHSAREFLFWRLGRLADLARTLYEYAVLSASETISAARTWQPYCTRA